MSFLSSLRSRARARPRRIGFPEADEERTAAAMVRLSRDGLVRPVAVAEADRIGALRAELPELEVMDPDDPSVREAAGTASSGGDPLRTAAGLVAAGRLDGAVAGTRSPTAEVVRAGLQAVGLAPGVDVLSSTFYLYGMARDPSDAGVLSFTDAAVVPDPSAEQLAQIARAAAAARRRIVGDEPRLAFLSYATRGSADGESVRKVRRAVELFREAEPDVPADGEMQADAALVASVGERKAPGSPVAGRANVLVFPDLDAGNIGYKLVERLAGAGALGPVLQGLARPLSDLSRGADVEDIVLTACVTGLAAG